MAAAGVRGCGRELEVVVRCVMCDVAIWFLCLQSPVDVSWWGPPYLSTMGDSVVPLQHAWRWAKTCRPRVCYTM